METIDLSKDIDANKLRLIRSFDDGDIYDHSGELIKIYNHKNNLENLEGKLMLLNETSIKHRPVALIKSNDILRGYKVETDSSIIGYKDVFKIENGEIVKGASQKLNHIGTSLYDSIIETPKKKKLEHLKQLKKALDELHNNGIIYGGLTLKDIVIHDENIYLYNIDKCKIDSFDFSYISKIQNRFLAHIDKFEKIDENLDNYILNLLSVAYLENIGDYYSFDYIINNGLPRILSSKENKEIWYKMFHLNGEEIKPFIDYVKIKK